MESNNSDIIEDNLRQCKVCNKIGIADCFYGEDKEYCSNECASVKLMSDKERCSILPGSRNDPLVFHRRCTSGPLQRLTSTHKNMVKKINQLSIEMDKFIPLRNMIENGTCSQANSLNSTFDIHTFAPVRAFHHAPMNDCWQDLFKNRVVVDICQPHTDQFWRAQLISSYGYFVKYRYLGQNSDDSDSDSLRFFLVNPRTRKLLPIIERDMDGKIIKRSYVPPNFMRSANIDHLFQVSKNVTTLNKNLHDSFKDCILTDRFDKNLYYETIDPMDPSRFLICKIVCNFADWLLVRYEIPNINERRPAKTAWVHPKMGFFRVFGWSQLVGYPIYAPSSYIALSLYALTNCASIVDEYLVEPTLLPFEPNVSNYFLAGTFLEFLDPFNHKMKIATVVKRLRFGFIVLEYEDQLLSNPEKLTRIIQHVTSPLIFPIGYSQRHSIPLYVSNTLRFDDKMVNLLDKMTKNAALSTLFPQIPNNNFIFKKGMILETFNMVKSGTICYAMIDRVVDRLISLRFINQKPELELWTEYTSPYIRPFGYTHMLDIDFKSPLSFLRIDHIRFSEFHQKIAQFNILLREYSKSMNAEQVREVVRVNSSNRQNAISTTKPANKPFILPPATIIKNPQSPNIVTVLRDPRRHVYKFSGTDYANLDNMMSQGVNYARGNYVRYPTIRIESNTTYVDDEEEDKCNKRNKNQKFSEEPTETNQNQDNKTLVEVFSKNPIFGTKIVNNVSNSSKRTLSDDNNNENVSNTFKKIKYDYSDMNSKRKVANFGYKINEKNLCNNISVNTSKRELFIEFQQNVNKFAELKAPKLNGLSEKPIEWTAKDVEKFLQINLTNYDDFKFKSSANINGKKFLQMDHNDFNEWLMESSMSLAVQINILKLCLIQNLKMDLNDIYSDV